ncbi:MAG: ATP-binding protein [Myxococcales bacterium]|nr:ATP-binding protein [Myxococcales bacterium]
MQPTRRMFFHGPPGCGKTLAAAVLAGELGMALLTVRMDSLFSRFLGATAAHLRTIFSEMPRRPAVYFFDEFDAVAKSRGDAQDVGEMNRVVTAFLQLVDADRSPSVLVAATNHVQIVDRAALRRFDAIVEFDLPDARAIYDLLLLRLAPLGLRPTDAEQLAERGVGHNFADLARACDDSIRTMVLDDREQLRPSDVDAALHRLKTRLISSGR